MIKNSNHIMCDLETLGIDSNSVIISAAFVMFNITTGEIIKELELGFNLNQQIKLGGIVDGDTVEFHFSQSAESIAYMSNRDKLNVVDALKMINEFVSGATAMWGNGATFDNVILRNLFTRHSLVFALPFWCDRDLRTAVDIYNINTRNVQFEGIKHYCMDDAKHQIKILTDKSIRNTL